MTDRTPITIAVSESKGPIPPRLERISDETGEAEYRTSGFSTKCPKCEETPIAGETITKIFGSWFHAECGAKVLREMRADQAWLALGHQLERSPSKFTNAETKAIVRNLLRISEVYVTFAEAGDDDDSEIPEWERPFLDQGSRPEPPPSRLRVIEGGNTGPDPWASAVEF